MFDVLDLALRDPFRKNREHRTSGVFDINPAILPDLLPDPRQELFLVAVPDKVEAVRAVQACLPDAEVKIDSEAIPDILAQYEVSDGQMFVVPA